VRDTRKPPSSTVRLFETLRGIALERVQNFFAILRAIMREYLREDPQVPEEEGAAAFNSDSEASVNLSGWTAVAIGLLLTVAAISGIILHWGEGNSLTSVAIGLIGLLILTFGVFSTRRM
jgi:hypothetical protein